MSSFKDCKGNIWDVNLVYTNIKRLKDRHGIDIGRLVTDELKPLAELFDDPCRMTEALLTILEDQIQARGTTLEQIGDSFDGDTIVAGAEAFEVALQDFFKKSNPMLKKVFDKAHEVTNKSQKLIETKLDNLTADEIIAKVQAQKSSASGSPEPSGKLLAS